MSLPLPLRGVDEINPRGGASRAGPGWAGMCNFVISELSTSCESELERPSGALAQVPIPSRVQVGLMVNQVVLRVAPLSQAHAEHQRWRLRENASFMSEAVPKGHYCPDVPRGHQASRKATHKSYQSARVIKAMSKISGKAGTASTDDEAILTTEGRQVNARIGRKPPPADGGFSRKTPYRREKPPFPMRVFSMRGKILE